MEDIELSDDTVRTSIVGSTFRIFGAEASTDSEPESVSRTALGLATTTIAGRFAKYSGTSGEMDYSTEISEDALGRIAIGDGGFIRQVTIGHASAPSIDLYYTGAASAGNKGYLEFAHKKASDGSRAFLGTVQGVAENNEATGGLRFIAFAAGSEVEVFRVNSAGQLVGKGAIVVDNKNSGSGIGYTTGAGGTVTQTTNKGTAVTLNAMCGMITTTADSLAANTTQTFGFINSCIGTDDLVYVCRGENPNNTSSYQVWVRKTSTTGGACTIALRNMTAGALAEAVDIYFIVLKAVKS